VWKDPEVDWPANFSLRDGVGCPMCENATLVDTDFGVRFLQGRVANAFLQRPSIQRGYSVVVWAGRHIVEPTQLTEDEAGAYWADVLDAGRAVETVFRPIKMNYETLGNSLPHLHTHVIPRYEQDPRPGRPFPFPDTELPPFPEDEFRQALSQLDEAVRAGAKRS
jgi:diadenosine tetraphosphate (Ap4A) HIT family hydrolase